MSSGAESLPDKDQAEVVSVDFERPRLEEQIEDTLGLAALSEDNRRFITETASEAGVNPAYLIDVAVESYKDLCELTENGGKLFVLGRDGRMHPLGDDNSNPAA